jgi:hypothetical protein
MLQVGTFLETGVVEQYCTGGTPCASSRCCNGAPPSDMQCAFPPVPAN